MQLMGIAKAKDTEKDRNTFLRIFFLSLQRNNARTKISFGFDEIERGIILRNLNELHNRLLSEGRYTDIVDELLIRFTNAKKEIPNQDNRGNG